MSRKHKDVWLKPDINKCSACKESIAKKVRKKVKSTSPDSPGLVDFAIGLVNSVFNLPNRQVMFFEEFE